MTRLDPQYDPAGPADETDRKSVFARLDELERQVADLTARLDRRAEYDAEQNERGPT